MDEMMIHGIEIGESLARHLIPKVIWEYLYEEKSGGMDRYIRKEYKPSKESDDPTARNGKSSALIDDNRAQYPPKTPNDGGILE